MINRRIFLEAAAASALPAIAGAQPAPHSWRSEVPARPAVHTFLSDARFAPSRTAAERLRAANVAVHTLGDGDVTQVWRERIGPAWREHPVTIAGLTARPALFCMEQLALGCGLRVVFHAEHVVHAAARTEHRVLRGAAAAGIATRDLSLAGLLWPAHIAQVVAGYSSHAARDRYGRSEAALDPFLPPDAQLLTSWIIAAT
ncbi:MAG TPA: hypothetical protein VHW25_09925 [Steroidobacteraceae bacterium]|jgi:hypothetical protein|nr:hypothetical protein [Steroidobacteraceae bacterium]